MSTSNTSNPLSKRLEFSLSPADIESQPQLSEWIGMRLDAALSLAEPIHSRSRAKSLIDEGCVFVNGKRAKASHKCLQGDRIEINIPEPAKQDLVPLNQALDVLFEDDDLLVINKPAGLVVHPGAGHHSDTLVNALIAHTNNLSMAFGDDRPGIVHRIDKETSGLLVVAKNDVSHLRLAEQFKKRTTRRLYEAVCVGKPPHTTGVIKSFLARHPQYRQRFASVRDKDRKVITDPLVQPLVGKWAVTHYKVCKSAMGLHLLELKLDTGRTHQIRVHLSEIGAPILGDSLYGWERKAGLLRNPSLVNEVNAMPRFLLHAKELGFTHPRSGEEHLFSVDWPPADRTRLESWGLL